MAKTSGKKPSAVKKPIRTAMPAPAKSKKRGVVSIKTIVKPAKKVIAKPGPRAPLKVVVKPVPVAKTVSKGKGDRTLKPRVSVSREPVTEVKVAAVVAPPVRVVEPPIPATNGKSRKNPAGFSIRELEHFRELLLAKRRELIGDMHSMEHEALRTNGASNLSNLPIHMADMGTDNYEQEFTLGLVQKDRDLLKEINLALAKIPNGTYGLCEGTSEPILKERLEYQPWARYSVEHQRKMERHGR